MSCRPQWSLNGEPCPSGWQVPLPTAALTWPKHAGLLDVVSVIFCCVPLVMLVANFLLLALRRTLRELLLFAFYPCLLQLIIGASQHLVFDDPRPARSCLVSCGMPSGHCATALSVFALLVCEVRRCAPPRWSSGRRAPVVAFASVALLPIPLARVQLGDHFPRQAAAGSATGVVIGILYFLLLRQLQTRVEARAASRAAAGHEAPDACCCLQDAASARESADSMSPFEGVVVYSYVRRLPGPVVPLASRAPEVTQQVSLESVVTSMASHGAQAHRATPPLSPQLPQPS